MSDIQTSGQAPLFRATSGGAYSGQRALLVPLYEINLLLPNSAVAEVIRSQELDKSRGMPTWWLGRLSWRGIHVPMISFEAFIGGAPPRATARRRVAVLNTISGNPALPFLALAATGTPQLQGITLDAISPKVLLNPPSGILCGFEVRGTDVLVPDLDALEAAVLAADPQQLAQRSM